MRVFVTGATGFVGSAVVQELIAAGHQVLGLARSDAGAASLAAQGAEVRRGSLEDVEDLRAAAAQADGVIHTAFNHDFSKFADNCELDRLAIEALGAGLEGTRGLLIVTSGLALLAAGRAATEDDVPPPRSASYPRVSEATATALMARGVRTATVRLAPSVHGRGDHGFVPHLIACAREKGVSAYVGEGLNRWPAVHRHDAARLYRLALEKDIAGVHHHAVAEEGVPFRDIAAVIGRQLDLPVVAKTPEEAREHFGWFAPFAAMDANATSRITRERLGWQPTEAGLIADMETAGYFES